MGERQRFSKPFKLEVERLMKQSCRPPFAIARELGIPRNELYN